MYSDAIRTTTSSVQFCTGLLPSRTLRLCVHACVWMFVHSSQCSIQAFPMIFLCHHSMIENVLVLNSVIANCPSSHGSHFEHLLIGFTSIKQINISFEIPTNTCCALPAQHQAADRKSKRQA